MGLLASITASIHWRVGVEVVLVRLVGLVELVSFYPPRLPVGSGTSLGAALTTVMDQIDRAVVKGNAEVKGDWKPIVYLFTDGKPTDDAKRAIERWKRDYAQKASLVVQRAL